MSKWTVDRLNKYMNKKEERYQPYDDFVRDTNRVNEWSGQKTTPIQTSYEPKSYIQERKRPTLNYQQPKPIPPKTEYMLTETLNQMYAEKKEQEKRKPIQSALSKVSQSAQNVDLAMRKGMDMVNYGTSIQGQKQGANAIGNVYKNMSLGVAEGIGLGGINRALGGKPLEERFRVGDPNKADEMARGLGKLGGQLAPQLGAAVATGGSSLGVQVAANVAAAGLSGTSRSYGEGKTLEESAKDGLRDGLFAGAGTMGSRAVGMALGQGSTKLGQFGIETAKGLGYDIAGYGATMPTYKMVGDEKPTLQEMSTDMIVGMLMGVLPDALEIAQLDLPTLKRVKAEAGNKVDPELSKQIDRRIYEMQEGYSIEPQFEEGPKQLGYSGVANSKKTYYGPNGMPIENKQGLLQEKEFTGFKDTQSTIPYNSENRSLDNRYYDDNGINKLNPYNQTQTKYRANTDQYGEKGNKAYNFNKKDAPYPELYDTYFELMYAGGINNIPYDRLPKTELDTLFPESMKKSFWFAGQNDRGIESKPKAIAEPKVVEEQPQTLQTYEQPKPQTQQEVKYQIEEKQIMGDRQKQVYDYLHSDKDGKKAKEYYLSPELKGVDEIRRVLGTNEKLIKFTDDKAAPKLDVMKMEMAKEFPEVEELGLEEFGTWLVDNVKKHKGTVKEVATMKQEARELPKSTEGNKIDRDTIEIKRLNRDTNEWEYTTFKRGEIVKTHLGKDTKGNNEYSIDVIEGIRNKKNKDGKITTYVVVGGVEMPVGSIYKYETPELPKKEIVGHKSTLGDLIEKSNKKNNVPDGGFTEADRVPEHPKKASMETTKEVMTKLSRGEATTLEEVRGSYEYVRDNEETIKLELKKKTVAELKKQVGVWGSEGKKKPELIDAAYVEMIGDILYRIKADDSQGISVSMGYGSDKRMVDVYKERVEKRLSEMTQEDLDLKNQKRNEQIQKHTRERNAKIEAVKNPKTLEEFTEAKKQRKLSAEEQRTYDELYALNNKTKAVEAKAKEVSKASMQMQGDLPSHKVTKEKDTRDNSDIWVLRFDEHLGEEYGKYSKMVKEMGGYPSRYKKGFIFKTEPDLTVKKVDVEEVKSNIEATAAEKQKANADKIRQAAENMQKTIDGKRADRLTNTSRRASMAADAERQADELENTQRILVGIAEKLEAGEIKHLDKVGAATHVDTLQTIIKTAHREYLNGIADADKLTYDQRLSKQRELDNKGYPVEALDHVVMPQIVERGFQLKDLIVAAEKADVKGVLKEKNRLNKLVNSMKENDRPKLSSRDIEDIYKIIKKMPKDQLPWYVDEYMKKLNRLEKMGITNDSGLRAALRELESITNSNRKIKTPEEIKQEKIKAKERELVDSKIASFFPTPTRLVDDMLDIADIKPGDRVLEPSAGAGDIADRIGVGKVDVVEYNGGLRELLELKGHNIVGSDALEVSGTYDKIIMNPPFEKNQDIKHVMKAFNDNLEEDGRIVAIMSNHFTFANDKESIAFREFVDKYGVWEPLPEGSFKDSKRSTGVNTVMVTLDKPKGNTEIPEVDNYSTSKFASTKSGPTLGKATGEYTGEAKKSSEIFNEFAEKLGMSIKGEKRLKGSLGEHNYRTELTKIKKANDIPVLAHETGHFLDGIYKFRDIEDVAIRKELVTLGANTSKPQDNPAKKKREGIAEFIRLYFTDQEAAKQQAPNFYKHFRGNVSKKTLKAIDGLQQDIWKLTNLSPGERFKKSISFRTDYMGMNKIKKNVKSVKSFDVGMKFKEIYTGVFDKTFPIEWAAGELGGHDERLKMRDKLGVSRGAEVTALYNIEYAQTDFYGKEIGPSFKEITEPIHKDEKTRQEFWTYAAAKRAMDYFERGLEITDDLPTIKAAIDEFYKPEYEEVFKKVQKYNENNLELLVECGMLSKEQVANMKEVNPNYIPLNRVQEAFESAGGKGGSKGVKRLTGGGQDIRDPEENILMNTYSYRKLAQEKMLWKDLADMADTAQGVGEIMVEAVPKGKLTQGKGQVKTTVNMPEEGQMATLNKGNVKEAVEKYLQDLGFDTEGMDMEFYSKLFTPDLQAGPNQVAILREGKAKLYDVHPFLYSVMKDGSTKVPQSIASVINVFSKIAKVSKAGIIFNPRYIGYNIARDAGSSLINTRAGLNPIDIGLGLVEGIKKGDTYKSAMRSGAFTGFFNTNDRKYAQEQIDHIMKEQNTFKRVMGKVTHPFETIANLIEPGELAARLPEYKKTLVKEYRKQYKTNESAKDIVNKINNDPRNYQSIVARAAFNARDLSLDFNKGGKWVQELGLNKMNNFFNSQVQGVGKGMRTFTNKEEGTRALLKGVMYLTLPSLGMWAYAQEKDKEMYDELPSYRKDGFINVPLGDGIFFPIPLPPEYSAVFSALPRRLIEKEVQGNPKAFDGYAKSLVDNYLGMDFIPTALKPMYEVATNKNFTGSPILSQGDLSNPPELQHNRYTSPYAMKISEMARNISDLSPGFMPEFFEVLKSPKQVDHLLKGYTGTLGTMIIKGNPVEGMVESFFTDARRSPQSMNYYYDYKESIAHDRRRYKASGELPPGYSEELRMAFNSYDKEILDLNDTINEMRDKKESEDKIQIYTDQRLELMKEANKLVEGFGTNGKVDMSSASPKTQFGYYQSLLRNEKEEMGDKWNEKTKKGKIYTELNSIAYQIKKEQKIALDKPTKAKAINEKIDTLYKKGIQLYNRLEK